MKATEVLMQEHRVIEVVLTAIDGMVAQSEEAGKLDGDAARNAVEFVRNFADKCHHGKEEGILFPALVERGIPQEGGPVGAMLEEHVMGRNFVKGMDEQIEQAELGQADAISAFAEQARGYTALLRQHIHKEDHVLFKLADQVLDNEDNTGLLSQYDRVEHDHMGTGEHERFLELGRTLAVKFVKPGDYDEAVFKDHTSTCCHGHHNKTINS